MLFIFLRICSAMMGKDDEAMMKPVVSKSFNLEDIRKIREYNSLRHVQMDPEEIIEDIRKGAEIILEKIRQSETCCKYQV